VKHVQIYKRRRFVYQGDPKEGTWVEARDEEKRKRAEPAGGVVLGTGEATVAMGVSGEWSEEISALERVMECFTALGGEQEDSLADLVTPYRRLMQVEDVHFKVMPFSANVYQPCRLYVFKDLVLVAKERLPTGTRTKLIERTKESGNLAMGALSSGISGWFASSKSKSRFSRASSRSSMSSSTISGDHKLVSKLDLHNTTIKPCSAPTTFQLSHVYRQRVGEKLTTKIDMVEVCCPTEEMCSELYLRISEDIQYLKDERLELESVGSGGGGESVDGRRGSAASEGGEFSTQRKWARSKSTLRKNASSRSWGSRLEGEGVELGRRDSTASGDSNASATHLSLADLESRYQVDSASNQGTSANTEAEFVVTFDEGPMGFSLSSGANVGVIVGKVADESMAFVGGVEVGDRIIAINEREVGLELSWRACVDIIKGQPRPVDVKFLRNFKVSAKNESDAASTGSGQRSWAKKKMRARSFGSNIISLNELESMYKKSTKQTGDDEGSGRNDSRALASQIEAVMAIFNKFESSSTESVRSCGAVLREILETERAYVTDLRSLIADYMIPLRRTVRRVRCKDRKDGSTFCEHRSPRLACSRLSSDSRPVLESQDIRDIFLNVETLVSISTELLSVIQKGLKKVLDKKKPSKITITDIVRVFTPAFVRIMPFFKMYSLYCHQYPTAINKLLIARTKNKELNQLLKNREQRSSNTLQSLLIKPVQRICKYPLLFQSLLKKIIPYVSEQVAQGADMASLEQLVVDLEKALDAVDKIAKSVNEKVGEQESLERMMEIYTELGGEQAVPGLISPHRRFVTKFDVLLRKPPLDKNPEPLPELVYLFSDQLVFASGKSVTNGAFNSLKRTSSKSKTGSLREKQRSLKKLMNFAAKRASGGIQRLSDSSTGSSGSGRNSNGSTPRKSGGYFTPSVHVTSRLDLRSTTLSAIKRPDDQDCYGISLMHVGRAIKSPSSGKTKNRSSMAEKVVTTIDKYELWLTSEPSRNQVLDLIKNQLDTISGLEAQKRQAASSVGAASHKSTGERKWRSRQKSGKVESKYAALMKTSSGKSMAA